VSEIDRVYARGHEDGVRIGAAHAESRLGAAIEALTRVTHALASSREEFERNRQRDLAGLALAVARKILMREVTADPDVTGELVARALELLPLDRSIEVRLHPDDLAAIGVRLEVLAPPGLAPMIQWMPEASLDRGSFVVESPTRVIDGRSDAALRALYERLEHD
jgi:flagellar biosynthesis/type III secretory pathway protein FliH